MCLFKSSICVFGAMTALVAIHLPRKGGKEVINTFLFVIFITINSTKCCDDTFESMSLPSNPASVKRLKIIFKKCHLALNTLITNVKFCRGRTV